MVVSGNKIGFLFDLDGVLIDSEKEYTRIWNLVNLEYPSAYEDIAQRIKGMTLVNILDTYYADKETQKKVSRRLHELEARMHYNWLPGARGTLEWLIDNDIPRVLVTSSDNKKMNHLREEIPYLEGMFSKIVTANMITRSKPDPEGYILGARLIDVNPVNCVVLEDSLQGVKAGRNAGAYVIGVAGTLPKATISPYSDRVVHSLEEVDLPQLCKILQDRR